MLRIDPIVRPLQVMFAVAIAIGSYLFVRTAMDAETRHRCTTLCRMAPNYANRDRLAPDFELSRLEGGRGRLSDYRGQVVVLNFWTKSCPPCLEELPALAALATTLRARSLGVVVTVNTDESPSDVRATLRDVLGDRPRFETFLDPESKVVEGRFGTQLFPETWFIDGDGVIRARIDGARDYSSALYVDFVAQMKRGDTCSVEFSHATAGGTDAWLCRELQPP